jgi:hypothetical protein
MLKMLKFASPYTFLKRQTVVRYGVWTESLNKLKFFSASNFWYFELSNLFVRPKTILRQEEFFA